MEAAVSAALPGVAKKAASKMEAGRRAKAEKKSQLKGQLAYNKLLKQKGFSLGSSRANAALAEEHALELAAVVQLDPETNQYKSVAGTMPAKKKAKEVLRRPMKQAAALLDAVPTRVAAAPLHGAARALSLHIDPTETKSPFYQETMENMLCKAGAKGITILKKPGERFPEERLGMRVRLDTGGAWQRHDERGEIVVEHLCKADLEQRFDDDGDSPLSFTGDVAPWFGRVSAQEYLEVEEYANEFHMRGIKKAKSTHDPLADDAWAIELGVSVYPGGSKVQMAAKKAGKAYELKANRCAASLMGYAEQAARVAWEAVERHYPEAAKLMLKEVGIYGMFGTGFSKVTIAFDNPTCAHYDDNYMVDVVLAFAVGDLHGGDHVMTSTDGTQAIVVETSQLGTLILGCHQHVLHGNLGTRESRVGGGRVIYSFYLAEALRKHAPARFKV